MTYHEIIVWGITAITALLGVGIIQWLKDKLTVSDTGAFLIAGGISVVLALAELWLTGQLALEAVTLETFPNVFAAVFALATIFYKLLVSKDTRIIN